MSDYTPPVGFYFSVELLTERGAAAGAAFQEVSGISVSPQEEAIKEGGQNRFTHRVPGRTNYEDLVLKRGLMPGSSDLTKWCIASLGGNLTQRIEPKNIRVRLLDANAEDGAALMIWVFTNAYPITWEVASPDAQDDDIVVESLTFAYSYFDRNDAP